jgi:hypothetical protein
MQVTICLFILTTTKSAEFPLYKHLNKYLDQGLHYVQKPSDYERSYRRNPLEINLRQLDHWNGGQHDHRLP